jgi:hypothetical protein
MLEPNKNKIEDIKRTLYDPNDKSISHQREGVLHNINYNVSSDLQNNKFEMENTKMKKVFKKPQMSIFKKFFIISMSKVHIFLLFLFFIVKSYPNETTKYNIS